MVNIALRTVVRNNNKRVSLLIGETPHNLPNSAINIRVMCNVCYYSNVHEKHRANDTNIIDINEYQYSNMSFY